MNTIEMESMRQRIEELARDYFSDSTHLVIQSAEGIRAIKVQIGHTTKDGRYVYCENLISVENASNDSFIKYQFEYMADRLGRLLFVKKQ